MSPWDELSRSIRNLQNILIEGVKITSNALERIKDNEQASKASGSAFGDHPDPHSWPSEEEAGEINTHDRIRAARAHAPGDRRVRDAPGGEARPAGRGDTSHDAPRVQARADERSGLTPALASKEIVCPVCYLATTITVINEPRTPAPGMLWACHECNELSVFDESLDLRIASDAEKSKARPAQL
jgi:hypothetical protein